MAKSTFQVPELHCEGCAEAIHDGLSDAPGVNRVDIDVATKRVAVDFDPDSTTDETVKNHIRDAGFDSKFTPERVVEERAAPPAPQPSAKLWLWLLTAGVAALALAGYIGYETYPRFNLPRAEGAGLFLLAAGAGIASFFSPCAFPLLVTLLARETGAPAPRRGRGLAFATALSLGAATFLVLVGIGIAAGAGAAFAGVTFMSTAGLTIRAVTAAFLILLGLVQLGMLPNPLHAVEALARPLMRRQARYRRRSPVTGFALFGFAYLLAGFGWTGPILAGLAGHAFVTGGAAAALSSFIVAAVAIVLLMFTLSWAITTAQQGMVATMKAHVRDVKRWGGWILIAIDAWLIVLVVFGEYFAKVYPV